MRPAQRDQRAVGKDMDVDRQRRLVSANVLVEFCW